MNRHVRLKIGLLIVLLGISVSGCVRQSAERVQWQGLCIPKDKVGWLQPGPEDVHGGWVTNTANHLSGLDKSSAPKVTVTFAGTELATAIPNYTPTITGKLGYKLRLGSVVSIKPMKYAAMPHQEAYIGIFKDVWNLSGTWGATWAGSKVVPLTKTSFYEVIPKRERPYDSWFALTTIDPNNHKSSDPPFKDISAWYIGTCGAMGAATGFQCHRALLSEKFYIEYTVDEVNIKLVDKIDQFMLGRIHLWAKACQDRQ